MQLRCADRTLDLDAPVVMGVLNVTPDSFSDGGLYLAGEAALARAERIAEEGAAILDIGGESTRPGAQPLGSEEELRRVLPIVERLAVRLPLLISVDTSNPHLIRRAAAAGAHMINDVRALRVPGALEAAAEGRLGLCLMHMRGEPPDMQRGPQYRDVVAEVRAFLTDRAAACSAAGIARERLCVDPGFGFGKTTAHNLELLRRLPEFAALDWPLSVGLSRKALLATLTGRKVADRLAGSVALATIAALYGARIVRAHDVASTVDAVRIGHALRATRSVQGG
ncbi:MAG TPA: dihydropteroate synthase [Steroidobacteraceae bacterium]|nr:dihydropteroate synthase [Steroidobacteraceae bacterium]